MKKGEILFREGEEISKFYMIIDGKISLTSTIGYEISAGPGEIIGEWSLIGESQESATAKTDVELMEVEDISFSWNLLQRAFERLEKVNKSFTSDLKPPSEVIKIINREKKGLWKGYREILRSPYYRAREFIASGDYESAFREMMKIDKRSTDNDIVMDSEIWKTFCMFFVNSENASRRYNALLRRKNEYSKYVSFAALVELVNHGENNLKTMVNLYLKHGILIPQKTILMLEGEMGDESYFVLSGFPRVARYSSGSEKILAFLGKGEFVGEVSTLGDMPRTATVLSGGMIQALVFRKNTLQKTVEDNENFGMEILRAILTRIRRMRKLKNAGGNPMKRIAILFDNRTLDDVNSMMISLEEMASYLGMSKDKVVSLLVGKKLASLRSDGTLRFLEEIRL